MWGRVLAKGSELRSAFAFSRSAVVLEKWWGWDDLEATLVADPLHAYGIKPLVTTSGKFLQALR